MEKLMPFFLATTLDPEKRAIEMIYDQFANTLFMQLGANAESTVAMRKLLESRDSALRAVSQQAT
jgi:hypothetical protein